MARVKIDLDRRLGVIDRKVYGMFIEHLGRCIYGGIYEAGSPLSDENGIRRDVLEASRGLQPPIMRYPGGNFVSDYHWLDGVGPKEKRPVRTEHAWRTVETNEFGTNEFIEYCRLFPTEPYICANMGTGTMDEAAAWVEYCNREDETSYAKLRAEHGFKKPHKVIYWGLGNEMYGDWQVGHKTAEDYAKDARRFAQVMKATDEDIKLVLCGGGYLHWDRIALEHCADLVDYISYHVYWGRVPGQDPYYSNLAQPYASEQYLKFLWYLIQQVKREKRVNRSLRIAVDEWNVWYRTHGTTHIEERYDLTDSLSVTIYMNMMRRNCQAIGMACLAQLVNVLGPIFTSPEGMFLQTIYHPLRLAVQKSGPIALDAFVDCGTYNADYSGVPEVPYLDVTATFDESTKRLFVSMVNLRKEESQEVDLQVEGGDIGSSGLAHVVAGESPEVTNDFENQRVTCQEQPLSDASAKFTYTMPPMS
ncbi:MAG: alpha-N-arabinofuranosidase, partial [Armatimonadetes bacterium]|nr:alpha-N-arabinofuranosidase [Armatimonadota bacterium]NIO95671.1 alpha-N-arabinofuranosidase [Armatimonadota bacterium]